MGYERRLEKATSKDNQTSMDDDVIWTHKALSGSNHFQILYLSMGSQTNKQCPDYFFFWVRTTKKKKKKKKQQCTEGCHCNQDA
jgi:hypothetical protein